mmetsp:Transcript_3953/g.12728  ORF Transcript_3953/g.12728 Transcript_3953/m.12728 type:complete len:213 (+) Transcript_3953:134-772(+)
MQLLPALSPAPPAAPRHNGLGFGCRSYRFRWLFLKSMYAVCAARSSTAFGGSPTPPPPAPEPSLRSEPPALSAPAPPLPPLPPASPPPSPSATLPATVAAAPCPAALICRKRPARGGSPAAGRRTRAARSAKSGRTRAACVASEKAPKAGLMLTSIRCATPSAVTTRSQAKSSKWSGEAEAGAARRPRSSSGCSTSSRSRRRGRRDASSSRS